MNQLCRARRTVARRALRAANSRTSRVSRPLRARSRRRQSMQTTSRRTLASRRGSRRRKFRILVGGCAGSCVAGRSIDCAPIVAADFESMRSRVRRAPMRRGRKHRPNCADVSSRSQTRWAGCSRWTGDSCWAATTRVEPPQSWPRSSGCLRRLHAPACNAPWQNCEMSSGAKSSRRDCGRRFPLDSRFATLRTRGSEAWS